MSDLHGDIMNIPCDPTRSPVGGVNAELAYKYGHRDARHAAAELASAHHAERAKPAEAEGPSFAEVLGQTSWLQQLGAKNKRIDELIAALSAVTAERDRLREEMAELWKRIDKFQSQAHGISALAEIERLRAESEALRADAERFRWLAHQGDACQWMNIIRVDPDDFESYAEAVDAAMAAKEA